MSLRKEREILNAYEQFLADLYCPNRLREQHIQMVELTGADEFSRPSGLLLWLSRLAAPLQKLANMMQEQGAIVAQLRHAT